MGKKSIAKNFLYNSIYNLMKVLFPLLTIPYVSRILLSDGLGKVNYAITIVSWFLLFASLGIPRYGVREIAKYYNDLRKRNTCFTELFIINAISTSLCVLAFYFLIFNLDYFDDRVTLYCVVSIQLVLNVFNVDWFYQGIEEYAYITKRSLFIKSLSLVLMFAFVRTHDDYIIYALIQSIAVACNYILNFINLRKYIRFLITGLNFKKHLTAVFILFSTQLAVNIYSLLDITMLGIMCNDSVVGYYSNVHKIIVTISTVTASLGGVMLPQMVRLIEEKNYERLKEIAEKALEIIVVMCVPMSVGLALLSKDLVIVLFGSDFSPCIKTMIIFSPFITISTVGNLFGTQLLMALKKERILLYSVIGGAILNTILNSFLIKLFQQDGAALASVCTEFLVMIIQIVAVEQIIKIRLKKMFVIQCLFMLVIMSLIVELCMIVMLNVYLKIFIAIFTGATGYFFIGYIVSNNAVLFIINKGTNYLKKVKK